MRTKNTRSVCAGGKRASAETLIGGMKQLSRDSLGQCLQCILFFLVLVSVTGRAASCVPAPAGLVSWWQAQSNALDSIGTNHAMLMNGATFALGEVGSGFLFSGGGNDYVALPANVFPFPTNAEGHTAFSFDIWFKTSLYGVILGQQDVVPFGEMLLGYVPGLYVGTNGLLYAQMFWGTGAQIVSTTNVNNGNFHHAAVTYDGTNEFLYLDGVFVGGTAMTEESYSTNYEYQLGTGFTGGWPATPGGWFPFHGVLDEPSLYNRALSASEVTAIFNAGSAGKCTAAVAAGPLKHRYSFSEPAGSRTAIDSIGGANGILYYANTNAPYTNGPSDGSAFSGTGHLTLNGNGYLDLPDGIVSHLSNVTIEAWVTLQSAAPGGWQRVFDFGGNDAGTNGSGLGTNYLVLTPSRGDTHTVGFIETTLNPSATPADANALNLNGTSAMPVGSETYVAVTYDPVAGSSQLFVNGALMASVSGRSLNPLNKFSDYNNYLGRSQYHLDSFFMGQFNEFRIWETILSAEQIQDHFVAGPDEQFLTVTRPTLTIAHTGANIVLTWPTNNTAGFQLQFTRSLSAANWQTVTNSVVVSNALYRVAVPETNSPTFYRLRL